MVNGHYSSTCTGAIIMDILLPADLKAHPLVDGTDDSVTVPFMFGITPREATPAETALKLLLLAKMYIDPPDLTDPVGCTSAGYNRYKHEYKLTATSPVVSFRLAGSPDSPIVNPCFLIKNWRSDSKATVTVNGNKIPTGKHCRQGIVRDTDGRRALVVWLQLKSEKPTGFTVTRIR